MLSRQRAVLPLLVLFVAVFPFPVAAQAPDSSKEADIRRLLDLAGTRKLMEQIRDRMMKQIEQSNAAMLKRLQEAARPGSRAAADRAAEISALYLREFNQRAMIDGLLDDVAEIYARHLTPAEIKELIAFYESPLGKRLLAENPKIVAESMDAGVQWGRRIGEEVRAQVEQKYPELKGR